MRPSSTWFLLALAATLLPAQQPAPTPAPADDPAKLSFMQYDPPSTLRVSEHPVPRAKFPFVDVHSHQFDLTEAEVRTLVAEMDKLNMGVMVNLSGRGFRSVTGPDGVERFGLNGPEYLRDMIALTERLAPGRIVHFTNVDFSLRQFLATPVLADPAGLGPLGDCARRLQQTKPRNLAAARQAVTELEQVAGANRTALLAAIGDADSPLRSQLLSALAQEMNWVDPAGRATSLGVEAVEIELPPGPP